MTPGQEQAKEELSEIESASQGALEILSLRDPTETFPFATYEISVSCSDMKKADGGIILRDRERFIVYVPPNFPFDIPRIDTPHHRFAGHPHVQWKVHLCLYQSPNTEWIASDGMFGLISRLEMWLRRAAMNQLDMEGAPLHPPVAYPTENIMVIPRKDTPHVQGAPWLGFVNLKIISGNRIDIEGWVDFAEPPPIPIVGAAILLSEPLPWEYPKKAKDLFDQLEKSGMARAVTRLVMAFAADINPEDSDLFVIIGTPMRGLRGEAQLKQHLTAWRIKKEMVVGLRLILNKYRPEEGLRAIGQKVERLMDEWLDSVDVGWCQVREDRPEVLIPRDSGTSMNVFMDRTIAIWGCGALGAPVAECIARAGAKKLILRDNATVSPGILSRQPYVDEDIGVSKAQTLAKRLKQIRPSLIIVESKHGDVRSSILDTEDWTDDADYVIDATASIAVINKLELRRKQSIRRIPVVSLVVGHQAHEGLVVVSGTQHSGGPVDVLRSTKIAACSTGYLGHYVDEFWPKEPRIDVFQPEPGCSEATFVGSAADSMVLAASMLNLAAVDLLALEEDSNPDSATAHFVAQPHATPPGIPLHFKFNFQPDFITEDPQSGFQIRISRDAFSEVQEWTRRSGRKYGKKAETGGVLFGAKDNACRVIWVSEVIGPPPDSESAHDRFICGIKGVKEANQEKRQRTRGSVQYLGMWHTHPGSSPLPSITDFLAMYNLVNAEEPTAKQHLMVILGSNVGYKFDAFAGFLFSKKDFVEVETHGIIRRDIFLSSLDTATTQIGINQTNNRYLVLSDMHFGTPESSINDARYRDALIDHMTSSAPWEEIVFIGDLLDINLSTFTRAIEGGSYKDLDAPLFGFREFLTGLSARLRQQDVGKGLKDLANKWIYVLGNHDYKIWDMLATKIVCENVLSSGNKMGYVSTPLMQYRWSGDESFIAGIFREHGVQNLVVVEYPNHEIFFGKNKDKMVLTHGHYLDNKQTSRNDLFDRFSKVGTAEEVRLTRRSIFIQTAQYQTLANAVSFTKGWRGFINTIVGPDAFGNRFKNFGNKIENWCIYRLFPSEKRRGEEISQKQLRNVKYYLENFCQNSAPPRWFIFGHTHCQGVGSEEGFSMAVYNAGSCYIDRGMPITFIEISTDDNGLPIIQLMCVDQDAKVIKSL